MVFELLIVFFWLNGCFWGLFVLFKVEVGVVDCRGGVGEVLVVVLNENRFFFVLKVEEDVVVVDGVGDIVVFLNNLELVLRDVLVFRVVGFVDGDDFVLLGLKRFVLVVEIEVVKFENFVVELVVWLFELNIFVKNVDKY